jgi:hypothetical protein
LNKDLPTVNILTFSRGESIKDEMRHSLKLDLDSNWPKIKSGRKASFFHTIEKILFVVGEKSTKILQKCMKKLTF